MEEHMISKKWTQEEIDFIKTNHKEMTCKQIANVLGRTECAVQLKLGRLSLKKTKYFYNKDFFNNIDTEEKAYWLGFMYADGYVTRSNSGASVGIELKKSDYKHLKKFNKSIGGNIDVTFRERKVSFKDNPDYNKKKEVAIIRIYSTEMFKDLVLNGCTENKTFTIKFPSNLREDLIRHFVRGFFDGDGSLHVYNHSQRKHLKYVGCNFTSASEEFLTSLRAILYEKNIFSYITQFKKCHQLCVRRQSDVLLFLKYIYDDANIYLDRKYNLYLSLAPSLSNK
jgi:DNA-binding transcriptional regulator WhiA